MDSSSEENLGQAFLRLQQSLRSYLRRRIDDAALVEDLLQDVFVKALMSDRSGKRIGNPGGWLYTAARNTMVDYYRSRSTATEPLDEDMPAFVADDIKLHEELSYCLQPFMQQLPPIYRDTLIATDIQGKTMRALAEQQQVSVSAIKSRASRARVMLKQKLLDCCQVEMQDGLVSDYHRVSAKSCSDGCTSPESGCATKD